MPETTSPTIPLGIVLTGGASRRMGTDKCELPWGDLTLREHALQRLAQAGCAPVLCAGGLDADIADAVPGQGPVSALLGIARYAAQRWPTHASVCPPTSPMHISATAPASRRLR